MIRAAAGKVRALCMGVVVAVMVAVVALMNGLFSPAPTPRLTACPPSSPTTAAIFRAGDGEETPPAPRGPRQQDWGGVDVNCRKRRSSPATFPCC